MKKKAPARDRAMAAETVGRDKTAAREGNWMRWAAIERLCGDGTRAVLEIGGEPQHFDRTDSYDYFLVNTDEFAPLAFRNSVIEVHCADADAKPGAAVLVAGAGRLELKTFAAGMREQILGTVVHLESWPGREVRHYVQ